MEDDQHPDPVGRDGRHSVEGGDSGELKDLPADRPPLTPNWPRWCWKPPLASDSGSIACSHFIFTGQAKEQVFCFLSFVFLFNVPPSPPSYCLAGVGQ